MTTTLAFVCVQNAGRSQMATAFAERECDRRGLDYEILTGGTHPADAVHPEVIDAMREIGIDLAGRTPREITDDELARSDAVATMGCSTLTLPDHVESHDWALDDPDGKSPEEVAAIRDEVERRVVKLFDSFDE
ncbi:MAG: low molecular weight phosphatase family protein [Halobacteriales archaeon]|nr:low molecular weight phosphatase family protein [Halobacteriales archaeon]